MIPFNERLTMVINALHLSPGDFGRAIDMNRVSVRKFLTGETKPSLDTLERICALDDKISADFLLKGVGEPLREHKPTDNADMLKLLFEMQGHVDQYVVEKIKQLADNSAPQPIKYISPERPKLKIY